MPIFESTFGGQKKRYNIPVDKVEEFKGKRPDAVEVTSKPDPIQTIGFGARRAGEITRIGAETVGKENIINEGVQQSDEMPGERTRRGIAEYESALKKTNALLKNPSLTPEQKQDILYRFKIAYGTLNPEDHPRITQDARAYLEQEGAGDVSSQWKSLWNAISLDRGWDISGRLKDLGAGLGLTQDPATMIREHKKVKNYLGRTASGQRDVRAEQEYLAHLDQLEKELSDRLERFKKEKLMDVRPKGDSRTVMMQSSAGAYSVTQPLTPEQLAVPVSDTYYEDYDKYVTASEELKKIRDIKDRAHDAKNKGRLGQMIGEASRRAADVGINTVYLGMENLLQEKAKNNALKGDEKDNIAREASELAMETERMYADDATISQMITSGIMESIPYMAEFAVTRGAAKMLKPATAARIAELGAKGGLKAAAKIAYHNANLAATMTVLQPSTYARAYELSNEDAVMNGTPAGGGLDFLGKAVAEQYITNASESAGDVFGSLRVKNAGGKVSRWKNVRKQVANITGVHGIPSEFMEEKTEEVGQALTGVGDTTWADVISPRRNIIMLGTVTFSQLPVQTITAMGYAAGKANNALTIRSIRKGYNRNVSNMVDVFGDESKEAMETVESFVASYGNSQEAVKAFDQAIIESDEYTDAEKSAMLNYAMAYAPMVGVDKEARERAEGYVAKASGAIGQSVNKDMDAVVTVRMDKNAAVLVGGKIVQKEDGSIDKENSDKTLYYRDENGKIHPIGIDAVDEVVESVPRAEALQQVSDAVSENVVKGAANAQAVERAVGEEVAFMVDGTSVVGMGVVQAMDDAGNYVVAMPDGSVSTVEPRQLVDEEVARMENGATILYADADGAKKKGVVADSFNYQGEGLIVLEDGTKVPFASILGVLEDENQDAVGEAMAAPSDGVSTEQSPSEAEEELSPQEEEVDVYADFPRRKNGEIDSAKLTDEQALVYAEREHGEDFAVESARVAIDALNKKRKEIESKMRSEGSVAKRADMQSQFKGVDKRIGVYQEYLKNREKLQDLAPSEEMVTDVKKEDVQKNIPENDLSLPKENTNISRDEVSKSVSQRHDGSLPERDRGMEEESDSFRGGFEASIRNAQTDKGVISEQEIAKAARAFAKKKGRWVPLANLTELGTPFPSGMENDVYYNEREGSVYKVNNLSLHKNNILSLLERIDLHNQLFPNTTYSLFGFAGFENGAVYPILKQDFVPNADFATPEEIDGYMHSMGFENGEKEAEYSNGKYVVSDLRPRNVLKSLSGNFYVIDAGVELNSSELPEKQEALSQSEDVNPLLSELESEVSRLSELFNTPVQVHYSPDTIQNATARKAAEDGLAKGWYVDGEVHIYLPNATGVEDIQETFFHEVVAHKGVKDMHGDKHSELMEALFDIIPESEQNRLLDLYGEKHIAADEYLAEFAERGGFVAEESRGIISKIVDAIREFLSRYHIQISSPTAEEIANSLLKESAARLTEKRKEADAPAFNGDILAYARDLHKRNQLRETAKGVEKNPSVAQQKAGNYKKGHVNVQGFDITIENPKGSTRRGVDESGKEWSTTMQNDYGYFKRSEGKDGDQIDVFIGNNPETGKIFVVDQINPETGVFDESKVMLGFNSEEEARSAYLSNYEEGWQGLGSITGTDAKYFKEWLYDGEKQRKAFSEYKDVVQSRDSKDVEFRLVGGNSGYVGYSMSKRAAAAREEGRFPKTDFKKEYGVSDKELQVLVDAGVIDDSEWHHTSKYGNKTTFYSWNGRYYHDVYLENKDKILKLIKDGKDDELFDLFNKGEEAKIEEWRNSLGNRALEAKREIMYKYHEYANNVRQKLAEENYTASDGSIVIADGRTDHLSMDVEKDGVRLTKRNGKRVRDNARREYFDYVNSRIMPESEWSEQNKNFVNSVLSKHRVSESDIKSDAADYAGGGDVRFRRVSDLGFYSTVEDALDKIKQDKGGKDQFKAMLLKNGAKQAEIDWMGFDELPDKLTKSDIQNWINENKIDVQEILKEQTIISGEYTGMVDFERIKPEKQEEYDELKSIANKWYRLEIDQSYGYEPSEEEQIKISEWEEEYGSYNRIFDYLLPEFEQNPDNFESLDEVKDDTKYSDYKLPGGENYRELLLTMPNSKKEFETRHFDENNIVAHVRFDEREANGERILFIEEVQSDWAQEIRNKGFVIDDNIPDMPFKKTGQWVNLAMRRMMRYASENGFDRIAWTTGEQQAERYNLSERVDRIVVDEEDGKYNIMVAPKGKKALEDIATVSRESLPDYIGKELSEKVIKEGGGDFSGDNLKIGESGMKSFYDNILPNAIKKLGKPFGANIETISLDEIGEQQSIPVTDSMSEGVSQGAPLFRLSVEESRIKERAQSDGTFMKAPNGQPTRLNERQWLQVRTKSFKKWFGDWEKSARIEKLRKAKPVEITGKEYEGKYELNRDSAKVWLKDNLRGEYLINDTREKVSIGRKGVNKVTSHSMGNEPHLKSLIVIPRLLEACIFISEEVAKKSSAVYSSYRYYVTGLRIGGVDYTAKLTVGIDENGNKFYDHSLTEIEKTKLIDYLNQPASGFISTEAMPNPSVSIGKDTKLVSLLQNNSSKVVDENGEPLVVYHGTRNSFTVFDSKMNNPINEGFYFTDNKSLASRFSGRQGSVGAYFLRMFDPNINGFDGSGATMAKSEYRDGGIFIKRQTDRYAEKGTREFIVFSPNQIKSATDNTGTFDAENNDIRFRLTDGSIIDTEDLKKGIQRENRLQRTMDKFYEAYQDTYLPVKRLYERIEAQGVKVEDWENFYAQATHIPGKNQAEIEVYTSKYMNPMIEQVKALQDKGFSFREIENYVMIKHGMERNEYMRERESAKYLKKHPRATAAKIDELKNKDYAGVRDIAKEVGDLGDLPEIGTAERIASKFVHDVEVLCGEEVISSFWDAVTAATRFSLTKSYHSGILSKAGYDELISRYKYYVPLRGHDAITAEDKWDYISENGSPTFSSPIKKARGRSTRAESPFAFIFQTAQSSIMAGNKNRLKSTLLNLAESGKAGTLFNISKSWYEKSGTDEQGNDVWELAVPKYDEDPIVYSENIVNFENRMKEEAKKGNAVQSRRQLDLDGMFIKPSQAAEHEIHIRRNGEDLVLYVNADPALARSVNGANRVISDSRFMHGARWSTRQIAAMSTSLNPLFTASNFMRDLQYSVVKLGAEKGGKFTAGYSVRLGRILFKDRVMIRMLNGQLDLSKKYDQYAYEFLMNGGKTGYVSALNLETTAHRIEKEIKRLGVRELSALNPAKEAYLASKCARAVGDFFVMSNEITENSIRLAAYITARESGESIINSVNTAKDVTVNFNRRGSGAMGADIVNSLFMFTNVAFQALDNFAKIAIRHKWKIAATMAAYMLSGFLQSWWIDEFGSDDSNEAYWGTSDWDRQNNLCIPIGRGLLRIPHPQELRALRGLGVGIYQSIKGTKAPEDTVLDLLSAVADVVPMGSAFVPAEASVSGVVTAVSPTVLQPVTQWVANINFKGNPVRNAYAPDYAPGHLQARTNRKGQPRADRWIYDLCEFINVSVGRGDGAKKGWIDLNPDAVQHFAGGYFGGLFNTASGTVNTIYMMRSSDDVRELKVRDTPLRRFYAETADMNNVDSGTMSKYYDISDKADQAHYMFGRYKKQLQDKSITPGEYRKKIEALNYPYWKSVREQLSAIRRLERKLKDVAEDEQVRLDMKSAEMKRRLVKRYEKDMEVKHEE